jgi:hypothetical protein
MPSKKIDPIVEKIMADYGLNPKEALWDCHGTWVMYHRYIEQIAAKVGIWFDPPEVLEANGIGKSVALCVVGRAGDDKREWSIGEASPANCKNSYPYAMAEKRAKDRVVLKLIGLHGHIYSDEEFDTNGGNGAAQQPAPDPGVSKALESLLEHLMTNAETVEAFNEIVNGQRQCFEVVDELARARLRKIASFKLAALKEFQRDTV